MTQPVEGPIHLAQSA